ncbi:MAG: phosphate propanoyltransferase [Clostridiales bacterium]|nr:phosphate propanoyltransferase [Clostridiales bacterium]
MKFMIETSARHMHVTQEDLETLFGPGHALTPKKDLSQPGQYASAEKVTVKGPRGELQVSILGPTRKATQVELSFTDARVLGITPPVRESGDIKGSSPCTLVGPKGQVELAEGVIVAKRHIHMKPADALRLGVKDQDIVGVMLNTDERKTVFYDTVVRVNEAFSLSMHIDTDEANAAAARGEVFGDIVK